MHSIVAVREHKGLRSRRFSGLGHINVICGRNNSGKSTVLEALANSGSGGVASPGSLLDEIDSFARRGMPARLYERFWPEAVEKVRAYSAERGDVLAEVELKDLVAQVQTLLEGDIDKKVEPRGSRLLASGLKADAAALNKSLLATLSKIYKNSFHAVLIPARRKLDPETTLVPVPALSPSGEGLLPLLFFCRNQRKESAERNYYEAVREAFCSVSNGYEFDLSVSHSQAISIDFQVAQTKARPASDCGLGLHEVLVIIAATIWGEHSAVCIEEPENHVHPDMQRRLLSFMRGRIDKQFFVSTHSNVFVNSSIVDRVFFTRYADGAVQVDDVTSRAMVLHDLGYSVADNLVSDLVILVEGPTDVPIVEEFLEQLGLAARYDIKTWPLGGDIMDQLDLSVLAARYKLLALVDLDPGSSDVRRRFSENCGRLGIERFQLQRYAIENYFTLDALRQVFGNQILPSVVEIVPNVPLKDQIGINVKRNNRKLARAMVFADIEHTDLGAFFLRAKEMLESAVEVSRV